MQLGGISGTVWNGSATEGMAAGVYMRNLSWQLQPLSLLTATLAFETRFDPASGFMDADVALSPGGSIALTDINGTLPVDLFHDRIPPLRGIRGNVSLQLERVAIDDGVPTAIEGKVGVSELMAAALSRSPIGDYEAVFSTDADGIKGVVKDLSGVLAVDGVLRITADRAYSLVGQVAVRPGTPSAVVQQMELLGSADAEGNREFRIEGQL